MAHRTFAVGDIHGDLAHLQKLFSCLPGLDNDDTIVFLGLCVAVALLTLVWIVTP